MLMSPGQDLEALYITRELVGQEVDEVYTPAAHSPPRQRQWAAQAVARGAPARGRCVWGRSHAKWRPERHRNTAAALALRTHLSRQVPGCRRPPWRTHRYLMEAKEAQAAGSVPARALESRYSLARLRSRPHSAGSSPVSALLESQLQRAAKGQVRWGLWPGRAWCRNRQRAAALTAPAGWTGGRGRG